MDASLLSAASGLMGAAIGGFTAFGSSWVAQRSLNKAKLLEAEITKHEALFKEFISEASRLYGDALGHQRDDILSLVRLYALVGRLRLFASRQVITEAERAMDTIVDTYLAPNLSLQELADLAKKGEMNFLAAFGETCRADLANIWYHIH